MADNDTTKGGRGGTWASNPNIAVYIFYLLFTVWVGFQIWARIPGGPPAPTELGPMVMGALGVAISAKSVQTKRQDENIENRQTQTETRQTKTETKLQALQDVATEAHPEVAKQFLAQPDDGEEER